VPSGRTISDIFLKYLERSGSLEQVELALKQLNKFLMELAETVATVCRYVAALPPSPGYEPLLIKRGVDPILARAIAHLIVHRGTRVARETKSLPAVVDAIRFLAKPKRRRAAISRRAKTLLAAWADTSVIETIFEDAGMVEFEFIELLEAFTNGDDAAWRRISEIAAELVPHLEVPRGPKVSAASATHELFLQGATRFTGVRAFTYSELNEDYTDPLTRATRTEFGDKDFSPRAAWRRVQRLRKMAQ
jgi:hypothetical protein